MEVFKWVLAIGIVVFALWQIILLAKNIVEREKNKKQKEQKLDETKVITTDNVENKED